MTAKPTKKTAPSEIQLKTMEIIRKALAPLTKLRKTKESYPNPQSVMLDIYPTFSMREEERATDSLEALLDEAGIKVVNIDVGLMRKPVGNGGITSTNVEIVLAAKQA